MPYDGEAAVFIDKYIHFGSFVTYHLTKEADRDEDFDEWSCDYENDGEVRLYDSLEECKACEENIDKFEKAKRDSKKTSLISNAEKALAELYDFDRFVNVSDILKKVGYYNNLCISEYDDRLSSRYESAAKILKRRNFSVNDTTISLDKITHIKNCGTNLVVYVGDTSFCISNTNERPLYDALTWIFDI